MKNLLLIITLFASLVACDLKKAVPYGEVYGVEFKEDVFGVYQNQDNTKRIIIKEGYFRYDEFINGWWIRIKDGNNFTDFNNSFDEWFLHEQNIYVGQIVNGAYENVTYTKQP